MEMTMTLDNRQQQHLEKPNGGKGGGKGGGKRKEQGRDKAGCKGLQTKRSKGRDMQTTYAAEETQRPTTNHPEAAKEEAKEASGSIGQEE